MTPDEIKAVVEATLKGAVGMTFWQMALLVVLVAAGSFFGAYLKEKAKSEVTKADIEVITRKVEEVKKEMDQSDRIAIKKYELKYNACLNMLGILDAQMSHIISKDNEGNTVQIDRQYATVEEVRKCHNDLLITIDNQTIIDIFLKIMVGQSKNPLIDLDEIRKLVREELGFKGDFRSDEERTWLGVIKIQKEG